MSEFLKTKFNSKILDKQEKKIETYIVYVNRCRIEITIDESTHSLTVYYVDFNITYSYRWRPFSSDKTFKEFIGQPEDIHYFLNKLGIIKDEFNLSKSKRELYSYSLRNFHYGLSKNERTEQLPIEIIKINDDYTADIKVGNTIYYGCYLNNIEENISDNIGKKVIVSFDYPLITKEE